MYNVQIRDETNLLRGRFARVFALHGAKNHPKRQVEKKRGQNVRVFSTTLKDSTATHNKFYLYIVHCTLYIP
jgi:hypothetical protein